MRNDAHFQPELSPTALRLYRIGAVSTVGFLIVGILAPMAILNSLDYDTEMAGRPLLEFIGAHRLWWIGLQTLTMGSMVFVIPPLIALYPILRNGDAAVAIVGIVLALSTQILFMAYFPVVNGFVWMADRYAETADPAYRDALAGGAEALVAQNNAYGTSDGIFAVSLAIISYAMRGTIVPRGVMLAGYLSALAGVVGALFKPQLGIHYLWWWVFFVIWFMWLGWIMARLGWGRREAG